MATLSSLEAKSIFSLEKPNLLNLLFYAKPVLSSKTGLHPSGGIRSYHGSAYEASNGVLESLLSVGKTTQSDSTIASLTSSVGQAASHNTFFHPPFYLIYSGKLLDFASAEPVAYITLILPF